MTSPVSEPTRSSSTKGRGKWFSKIAPIAVATALMLLNGVSYAADKIILACSVTVTVNPGPRGPASPMSLVIDLDQQTVTTNLVDFSITKPTDNSVEFEKRRSQDSFLEKMGRLDRISGSADVWDWSGGMGAQYQYQLTCKRAKPVF
jgi:hypothetical protein